MQETTNLAGGMAGTSRESNVESHRGRNFTIPQPIAEEEQQQPQLESAIDEGRKNKAPAAAFIDSVKKFFAPCVGAVDAASLYIGECRPSNLDSFEGNDQGENVAEDVIMKLRERNGGFNRRSVKRRNETLEIPTHGMLFDDDDVSAISSHTLEEMERLRMAQNGRISNFQMSPSSNYSNFAATTSNVLRPTQSDKSVEQDVNKLSWNNQKQVVGSNATNDLSICVSASDSSSSEGIKEEKTSEQTTPPSWGSKSEKDEGFKTHHIG